MALFCRNEGNREGISLETYSSGWEARAPLFIRGKRVTHGLRRVLWRCKWGHSLAASNLTFPCLAGLLTSLRVLGLEGPLHSSDHSLCSVSQMGRGMDDSAPRSCQRILEEMPPEHKNTIPDLGIRDSLRHSGRESKGPGPVCVIQDWLAGFSCLND